MVLGRPAFGEGLLEGGDGLGQVLAGAGGGRPGGEPKDLVIWFICSFLLVGGPVQARLVTEELDDDFSRAFPLGEE